MPQLIFRGVEIEDIKKISTKLVDDLEAIIECPRDYFTLEYIESLNIFDEREVPSYPFIEVKWFDRGQEVKDKVAKSIDDALKSEGYDNTDIFFTNLNENDYYENGKHF